MSVPRKKRERAKDGLSPEQWALVQANLRLVDDVAIRHFPGLARQRPDYLRSLGTVGLEDAVRTFDPARGHLRNHAWMRIRGAILDGLESDGSCAAETLRRARLAGVDFAACQAEGPDPQSDTEEQAAERFRAALRGFAAAWKIGWVFGGHGDDAEAALRRAARARSEEEALAASGDLPERDRQILHLRYREGHTWPEVAVRTGIPEGTLYHHHHAFMKRLAGRLRDRRVDPIEG